MNDAHLIYIADVYCPWCYGFAPVMRRLCREFPQFPVKVYGGDLMSRPVSMAELARMQPDEESFWVEVERVTGRSLKGAIDALVKREEMTLYSPGADALHVSLEALSPGRSLDQLIMLEDMFYGAGMNLFSQEAAAYLGARWKISPQELTALAESPETAKKVRSNLAAASELMGEINSYPCVFLVRGERRDAVSRGYVHYETVEQRLKDAMADLGLEEIDPQGACSWPGACNFSGKRKI